jgi:3-oxoadipate enol-lactonase
MEAMVEAGADKLWAEDSTGDGPTVVLLHPGVGDSRVWDPIWPVLTRSRRVIRYDVRGFGRSLQATEPYTLLSDLRAVLDYFDVGPAHLVGCSMGGATAIDLALADPGSVVTMVLLCPGVSGYPWPDEPDLDAEIRDLLAADDEDRLLSLGLREWAAAGSQAPVVEQMRSAVRAWSNEATFQRPDEPDFERLHELLVPTVVMVGDRDRPALIACNEWRTTSANGISIPRSQVSERRSATNLRRLGRLPNAIIREVSISCHCVRRFKPPTTRASFTRR